MCSLCQFLISSSENGLKYENSRSQFVTLKKQGSNIKYLPYAFTEQGVAMLSSILRSDRAVEVNIEIMRTFVKLRKLLATNEKLAQKFEELEKNQNAKFKIIFEVLDNLMNYPEKEKVEDKHIGFDTA